jgi:hypothetical protein
MWVTTKQVGIDLDAKFDYTGAVPGKLLTGGENEREQDVDDA